MSGSVLQRKRRGSAHTENCYACFYCGAALSPDHAHDHFPKVFVDGGDKVVSVCHNCHSLKDSININNWPATLAFVGFAEMGPAGRLLTAKCVAVASQASASIKRTNFEADQAIADLTRLLTEARADLTRLLTPADLEKVLITNRVRQGMRNAAAKGVKLGRPTAAARPKVVLLLPAALAEIAAGTLSRRQAAKRLGIGTSTLIRLLAAA